MTDPSNTTGFWDIVAKVMNHFPDMKAGGMQGYSGMTPPPIVPSWTWSWSFDVHDKPNGTIESLIAPILQMLDPHNGTSFIYTSEIEPYPTFFSLWNSSIGEETVATTGAVMGSRLLPALPLTEDTERLARTLENITVSYEGMPAILLAYMIAPLRNDTVDEVSTTPAWRDAILHTVIVTGFPDNYTFAEAQPYLNNLTYQRVAGLKSLAPESGAYLNEADGFDPNWQHDFWGGNYPRLRAVKEKYDPDSSLWCISCVGSEYWTADESGRLCKVP